MRLKQRLGVSVFALMLISALDVKAADDSYVDLSVLNNLQPGDSLFVETQPLFPIVREDTSAAQKVKKAKAKKAKKKSIKKQNKKAVKVKEAKKEQEEKLEILQKAPEIPQPIAAREDRKVESKNIQEKELPEVVEIKTPLQEAEKKLEAATSESLTDTKAISESPQIKKEENLGEIKTEPLNQVKQTESVVEITTEALSRLENSKSKENVGETIPVNSSDKAAVYVPEETEKFETQQEQKEVSALPEKTKVEQSLPQAGEQNVISEVQSIPQPDNAPIQPLIPSVNNSIADNQEEIRFSEGSYEISEENAQKIISLINTFENPKQNKIAIYAYNYDNGENSFKKKKLSLDRATEIRSLLLNKGYKNFSIKVINVTDTPDKSNLVEIEEIK